MHYTDNIRVENGIECTIYGQQYNGGKCISNRGYGYTGQTEKSHKANWHPTNEIRQHQSSNTSLKQYNTKLLGQLK